MPDREPFESQVNFLDRSKSHAAASSKLARLKRTQTVELADAVLDKNGDPKKINSLLRILRPAFLTGF
jgi:hypothetical protein